jgi:hypothetical protein
MFRKKKKRKFGKFYKRKEKKQKSSKFLELFIVFLTFLLLIYGFSFFKKISQGETTVRLTQGEEPIFVRTQILNWSQKEGLAQRLADKLREMRVGNIIYNIVQVGNLEHSKAEQSFIMDRTTEEEANPSEIALLTAFALGIDKENVICKKLENNYQEIELTLVIGKDHQRLFK